MGFGIELISERSVVEEPPKKCPTCESEDQWICYTKSKGAAEYDGIQGGTFLVCKDRFHPQNRPGWNPGVNPVAVL